MFHLEALVEAIKMAGKINICLIPKDDFFQNLNVKLFIYQNPIWEFPMAYKILWFQ